MKSILNRGFVGVVAGMVAGLFAVGVLADSGADLPAAVPKAQTPVPTMETVSVPKMIEKGNEAKWYLSPGIGVIDFEGDQSYKDGTIGSLRLGYDVNDRWTFEGVFLFGPQIDANTVEGRPAPTWDSTTVFGFALDGLFHFTRWERLDPYVAAGIGFAQYGEKPAEGDQGDSMVRIGGGVMYHFNDEWAIRADYRGILSGFGQNPNGNSIADVGLVWTWGAAVPIQYVAVGGPKDSDNDGLTDKEELEIGTDPYDRDTDKDRLTDGEEVKKYHTDPLNPDTDYDGLKDGAEVYDHKTDPRLRDTDKGGVADGHEVIEDHTNPLDPKDDLILIELYIQFDYDQAVIKPEYAGDLEKIAKMLKRNPGSTARIEGHADRSKKSGYLHNKLLSGRRANAVLKYLADKGGIAAKRMEAVGYGYSRPKAANDPKLGNPVNRRVEIYIRNADAEKAALGIGTADVSKAPAAGAKAAADK